MPRRWSSRSTSWPPSSAERAGPPRAAPAWDSGGRGHAAVTGLRLAALVELVAGPQQAVGQQSLIAVLAGGRCIVSQRRAEDPSLAVLVDPGHDVVLLGGLAVGRQQGRG